MNSRIKEQDDNVIYVNFTPDTLSEDYVDQEEEKMFNSFKHYEGRNFIVSLSILGILMSSIILILLAFISTFLLFS